MSQQGDYERQVSTRILEAVWIRVEPSYALPRLFESTIDSTEYPAVVVARVRVDDDGSAHFASVNVEGREGGEVTTATMRALPMKTILRQATTAVMEKVEDDGAGGMRRVPMRASDAADFAANYGRRRRNSRTTKRELAKVATVYRTASRSKDPNLRRAPTQAVADHFGISRATAGRRVDQAKRASLLH